MDTQCTMTWCAQRRRGAAALGRSFRPTAPRIGRIMREARALCARPKSRLQRLRLPCYTRLDLWWRWSLARVAALLARATEPVNADWTRRCILGHESGGAGLEGFAGPVPVRVL